jgi:hypothetical protein
LQTTLSPIQASSFYDSGNPAILNGSTPTGGNGTYSYQWQSSTTSATLGFSNITAATGKNFDPPAISQTTYYKRDVTSGTGTPSSSNVAKITVVRNGATINNPINIGNFAEQSTQREDLDREVDFSLGNLRAGLHA